MEAQELIAGLSQKLGVELEGGDLCSFEADDITYTLSSLPAANSIIITGDLGDPPPEKLEGLYKTLLAANYLFEGTDGAALSLESESGRLAICKNLEISSLDVDGFYSAVEKFVNNAESWAGVIRNYREATEALDATAEPEFTPGSAFMQV